MLLLSVPWALRRASALALVSLFVLAPARAQEPQHTGHDTTAKVPAGMKMGTMQSKKKKSAAAAKKTKSASGKKKASAKPAAKTRSVTKKPATHPDTAHAKMDAKEMEQMPVGAKDSAHMDMPNMPSHLDSAHVNMPGMTDMPTHQHDTSTAMKAMQPGMRRHTVDDMMIGPAGVSMERMGSGTTWIPDAVTMPNRRRMLGDWMVMAHGFAFLQYDKQNGERGDDQFGSLNWMMLMATHDAGGGRFQARTMLSLDPWTVSNRGYPLLLQSGESFKGEPLHDRQHPHDFWMELGALYQRTITQSLAWSIYAAPSGEPALGPVAFMHRPSAMDNPTAPISHHWQDATHVSFGVLTTGIYTHTWQLEGSIFNGREPDDNRWNFDPIKLDSYSGRLTLNPNRHWSFEGGYGYLKSPEALTPRESIHRITASAQHGAKLGNDGQIASAFVWGANKATTQQEFSNSFLLESEAILDRRNTLFGRSELVQKSAEELVVADPVTTSKGVLLPGFPADERFNVGTLQLGYIREVARTRWATIGLGGAGTLNFVPSALEPYYASKTPVGMFIFLRLRPFHVPRKAVTDMSGMKIRHDDE